MRQQKRHRCKEQTFGLSGDGEGGVILQNSIETCTLSYVKQMTSRSLMHETLEVGALGQPGGMGWGGRCKGDSGQGNTFTPVADSCQCTAKTMTIL